VAAIRLANTVEIHRVANGWIVYPGLRYRPKSDEMVSLKETHVFESWEKCQQFIFMTTEDAT
jgi:hypothetical protein